MTHLTCARRRLPGLLVAVLLATAASGLLMLARRLRGG
jgi:hypothetical protein